MDLVPTVSCQIVGAHELKARWAYAESNSSRFGEQMRSHISGDALVKVQRNEPFRNVSRNDWPQLIAALNRERHPEFVDLVTTKGSELFECVEWTPSELLSCGTLPMLGGYTFFRFLAQPVGRDQFGELRWDDPRLVCAEIRYDPDFEVSDPIIAIRQKDRLVLLEGYLRSILWLRNPSKPLRVWVPRT